MCSPPKVWEIERMMRPGPSAGRRFLMAAFDTLMAYAIGACLSRDLPQQFRLVSAFCIAAGAIVPVSILNGYLGLLRKPWSSHLFVSLAGAISSSFTYAVFLRSNGLAPRAAQSWARGACIFCGFCVARVVLLTAHKGFLKKKRAWVIAENVSSARQLARKVATSGLYEVVRATGRLCVKDSEPVLGGMDAVICAADLRAEYEAICRRQGKQLILVPAADDLLLSAARVSHVEDRLLLELPSFRVTRWQRFVKRAMDLTVALSLLGIFAPLMLLIILLIRRESKGGAIFRQERRGLEGRPFAMFKFRTMIADAERLSGPVLAGRNDPRVTRLGSLLRATRFDELPQLLNVLRGEMSMVGPRPEREFFAQQFERELPSYSFRTAVKPGITGLAQVWGSYASEVKDKLLLDLLYLTNASVSLDLHLLAATVGVMLHRKQAAGVPIEAVMSLGLPSIFLANDRR